MSLKHVTSHDNPDYRGVLALADDARARRQSGQTLLDGEHLIEEALKAGIQPLRLILESGTEMALRWHARLATVPALELAPGLFRKLSPVAAPSGVLAVIATPHPGTACGDFVLLLEAIQDPGNLGAILRTAAATGVTDVLLSPGCAEAWSPKALRGGQGGQFRLRVHPGVDLVSWLDTWSGAALAAMPNVPGSLYELDLSGPVAFAFGNEGAGLSPALQARCRTFAIPMAGEVESLNVAASVAVCLYERLRQGLK
ncbi:MAG: RNA methyltransferase [Hydrogenophilales bacterium]|nr:RNA methyltransferase [Hydrogenophilales bacterium]